MTLPNVHRIIKSDYLMLLPILALAFYLAFIPHHNYPYPVHIDNLLFIHAPTAVGLVIILIPYILLNLKSDFKHSLGISLAIAITGKDIYLLREAYEGGRISG